MARKILLADDSVTAQNMGRKILTDAGYEVVTVNNGSAALKKMAESKPDLIVLDVYMPGYSGLEVCQRIKENRETARIPVLLTVGKLEPFKPEEARRARADAFVVKPFEASELLTALTKLEDKIIPAPEPYKPGRFARAMASVEEDSDEKFGDSDAGWKARLRIPTGPSKARDSEPDVDYAATQGKGFRDLPEKQSPPREPAKSAGKNGDFERPIPTGLPNDITPEEIAAITAAAAQLRGGKKTDEVTPKDTPKKDADTPPEMPVVETPEEAAPVTFASSPTVSEPQPEPISAAAPDLSLVEVAPPIGPENETAAPAAEAAVPLEAVSEGTMPAAVPESVTAEIVAETPELPVEAAAPPLDQSQPLEPEQETVSSPVTAVDAAASTTDDEVMAALQTLMPSSSDESQTPPSLPESAEAPMPAWPGVETQAAGPRWIAEEVALADDEANLSLEQEMAGAVNQQEIQASAAAALNQASAPVATISEESPAPAIPTQELPAAYVMASAAAAAGDASAVPLASSSESPIVYESPAIEAPAVREDHVSEPEAVTTPSAEGNLESETVGGTDIMAANWKNIRDSIAGAAAKPAPSKEELQEAAPETPEPPAPTPAPEASTKSLSASDPTAIASIVDSVLAELRPKIVEEIARKLSDPKK